MANISEVEDTLVNIISGVLYPDGVGQPSIVPTIDNIYVYAGWAKPDELEQDILQNNCHVSIFPMNNGRDTTRFPEQWNVVEISTPTLTITVDDIDAVIGGTVTVGEAAIIVANYIAYSYKVVTGDTTAIIASELAALIPGAVAIGSTVSVAGAYSLVGRVSTDGTAAIEYGRQECTFNIITWADTRDNRTYLSQPIQVALTKLKRFVTPSDDYYCPIKYVGLKDHDELQKTYAIYRRDLMFSVEYATTDIEHYQSIGATESNIEIVRAIS